MPIHHNVEQRSEAWDRLRLGIPTASCFDKIVTPGGKPSEQYKRYAYHLIAERLLDRKVDSYTSPWMERGALLEEDAVDWYELDRDVDTLKIGFITDDAGKIGCSPDRLIGNDGMLEIKVPGPAAQVEYLCTGRIDRKYKPQLQGNLYIAERQWIDILAWNPELPRAVIRVERDEKFIGVLAHELKLFNEQIETVMDQIRSTSAITVSPPKPALVEMLHAALEANRPIRAAP